ncbi:DUF1800 domain-containing protein [Variovorax sp. dw_308]|uniref:DUF1800 domain-containing protein n=1 Tax=Variovorax sp. dw_308 TaxID=2721546 RepID=UPI001C47A1A4|nr:DUF1800 domain-containing protein [Variovorax sp. dw_308]
MNVFRRRCLVAIFPATVLWLAGCVQPVPRPELAVLKRTAQDPNTQLAWLDRLTWGASASSQAELTKLGLEPWLQQQLNARPAKLPAAAQAQIDAMTISNVPLEQVAAALDAQRKAQEAAPDPEQKRAATLPYQQDSARMARETQQRFILRALYSPSQLQEQMTWFWMNHFNVSSRKVNLRGAIADYEENAVRPHALGKFRELLGATLRHPAMQRYLDNAQNAGNRLNENYARELMELHTLGVDGGYTQADVQELARVLTGVGITLRPEPGPPANLKPALAADYVRQGLFEFNPIRHDYGAKTLLGQPITKRGLAEIDEALDRLARAPATARFISRKLAVFFVSDEPSDALVARMAAAFTRSDGDIASTLATLFATPEFAASLGHQFRDPLHYVVAGVRLAYDDRVVSTVDPVLGWIDRMGEPLYGHETPDGYSLTRAAWSGPGQMVTRFEIARTLGASGGMLFRGNDPSKPAGAAFPALAASQVVATLERHFGAPTRAALADAKSPQDWNTYLLASPEFMNR